MRHLRAAILGICAAGCQVVPAAADSMRGPELAAPCAACHRLDGTQAGTPTITGRPADDLVRKLRDFRQGAGDNHIMTTVCRTLSDEEIVTIARYLSTIGKQDAHR